MHRVETSQPARRWCVVGRAGWRRSRSGMGRAAGGCALPRTRPAQHGPRLCKHRVAERERGKSPANGVGIRIGVGIARHIGLEARCSHGGPDAHRTCTLYGNHAALHPGAASFLAVPGNQRQTTYLGECSVQSGSDGKRNQNAQGLHGMGRRAGTSLRFAAPDIGPPRDAPRVSKQKPGYQNPNSGRGRAYAYDYDISFRLIHI